MEVDPLVHVRWKLWRAHQHHELLDREVQGFLKSDFYRTVSEQDRKGRLVERVTDVDPMPPLWGVLVSDFASQVRSTLDHLLFLVAQPATEREESNLQFPICDTRKAWREAQWRMSGTTRAVRRAIDEVQPYHRRKWPETLTLAQLREINNWDKHRSLLSSAAFAEVQQLTVRARGTSIRQTQTLWGRIKPGAILSRVEVGESIVGAQVNVDRQIAKLEVFADGSPRQVRGKPIRTTLANIGNFIETEVLPRFERLIDAQS